MTGTLTTAQLAELRRLAAALDMDLTSICLRRWWSLAPEDLTSQQASDLISYLRLQADVEGARR